MGPGRTRTRQPAAGIGARCLLGRLRARPHAGSSQSPGVGDPHLLRRYWAKGSHLSRYGADMHCMTDITVKSPDIRVRLYLMYLSNSSQLVDAAEAKRLRKAVDTAKDPVAKLRALAPVDRAKNA